MYTEPMTKDPGEMRRIMTSLFCCTTVNNALAGEETNIGSTIGGKDVASASVTGIYGLKKK